MLKINGVLLMLALLVPAVAIRDRFAGQYKTVEAYEVRPGVLMMPSYGTDGQLCSVELEKLRYAQGEAILDQTISHQELLDIVNELAPPAERGPKTMDFGRDYMSAQTGNAVTTFAEYKNVSVNIYGQSKPSGDVLAVIRWKNHQCK